MENTERNEKLKALGLSIEATFIPFSTSRNKDSKHKSLNWKVTLLHNNKKIHSCEYTMGQAHCPSYEVRQTIDVVEKINYECEKGCVAKFSPSGFIFKSKPIDPPTLLDVCYSLANDASAGDLSFEEFCEEFAYNKDSRSAEKTYFACREVTKNINPSLLQKMLEIVDGY